MRNLIFSINITLDGCCDHTAVNPSEELYEYYTPLIRESSLLVYGRKTYELMVPYWPDIAKSQSGSKPENDFALAFDAVPKAVFSRSLHKVEDANSRVFRGDLREEILKLKQQPGKPMLAGGVDLSSQLMALGLVDEYRLVVHPVIAGKGRRLMEGANLPEKLQLKFVDSKASPSGFVALRYLNQ